jgi:hypothetical protein
MHYTTYFRASTTAIIKAICEFFQRWVQLRHDHSTRRTRAEQRLPSRLKATDRRPDLFALQDFLEALFHRVTGSNRDPMHPARIPILVDCSEIFLSTNWLSILNKKTNNCTWTGWASSWRDLRFVIILSLLSSGQHYGRNWTCTQAQGGSRSGYHG